jgi:hypothetical protein
LSRNRKMEILIVQKLKNGFIDCPFFWKLIAWAGRRGGEVLKWGAAGGGHREGRQWGGHRRAHADQQRAAQKTRGNLTAPANKSFFVFFQIFLVFCRPH